VLGLGLSLTSRRRGTASWALAALTGYQGGLWPNDSYAANGLWQNAGKTTPAIAVNDPVKVITDPHYNGGMDWTCNGTGWLLKQTAGLNWYLDGTGMTTYYTAADLTAASTQVIVLFASAKAGSAGGSELIGFGANATGQARGLSAFTGWYFTGNSADLNCSSFGIAAADTGNHSHAVQVAADQKITWTLDGVSSTPTVPSGTLAATTGPRIYGMYPGLIGFNAGGVCYGAGIWFATASGGDLALLKTTGDALRA